MTRPDFPFCLTQQQTTAMIHATSRIPPIQATMMIQTILQHSLSKPSPQHPSSQYSLFSSFQIKHLSPAKAPFRNILHKRRQKHSIYAILKLTTSLILVNRLLKVWFIMTFEYCVLIPQIRHEMHCSRDVRI